MDTIIPEIAMIDLHSRGQKLPNLKRVNIQLYKLSLSDLLRIIKKGDSILSQVHGLVNIWCQRLLVSFEQVFLAFECNGFTVPQYDIKLTDRLAFTRSDAPISDSHSNIRMGGAFHTDFPSAQEI